MNCLNSKQVAAILGYSQRHITHLVKEGKLKTTYSGTKFFLFDAEEVRMFNLKKLSNGDK